MLTKPFRLWAIVTRRLARVIAVAGFFALQAFPAGASIDLSLLPAQMAPQPGDTIQVELTVVNESSAFNAYDARVTYDPTRLMFMAMSPLSAQEGPLMTEACAQRFHLFSVASDSTYLQINHSLLCSGVSVSGPGIIYRLRFRCRSPLGPTYLAFGTPTAFYNDGIFVTPVNLQGAMIDVGNTLSSVVSPNVEEGLRALPSPFDLQTTLTFSLDQACSVKLGIHDLSGRRLRTLADGHRPAGRHQITWDGRDEEGRSVAAGVYFAIIQAGDLRRVQRLVFVR